MKPNMRRLLFYFSLAVLSLSLVSCGNASKLSAPSSSTGFLVTGFSNDGGLTIHATSEGGTRDRALENAMIEAVKQLVFRGIPGDPSLRVQAQRPLVTNPEVFDMNKEYFKNLFSINSVRNYVQVIPGSIPQYIRTSSGYKVNVDLSLSKDLLRKELERSHIIKSLNNIL